MILYASFRTDIPAYYGEWLYNRFREGFILQPNPMNSKQVQRIDVRDIEAIVFCSKDYRPFMKYVNYFNDNFKCLFHYTITSYEQDIEPKTYENCKMICNLKELSNIVSKDKVIWRYDPILFTKDKYTLDWHKNKLLMMSNDLCNYTNICIFSFVSTIYPWVKKNIPGIVDDLQYRSDMLNFIDKLNNGIQYQTCGHGNVYEQYSNIGISSCTSVELLEKTFNVKCNKFKGGHYRPGCGCIPGTNVGQYNTCMNGCKYCYAARPTILLSTYDPNSPILFGTVTDDMKIVDSRAPKVFIENRQLDLFDDYET